MTKVNQLEFAIDILKRAIENCGDNGNLYYMLAQVEKMNGSKEGYIKAMNNALKFNSTLSIAPKLVKKELDKFLS